MNLETEVCRLKSFPVSLSEDFRPSERLSTLGVCSFCRCSSRISVSDALHKPKEQGRSRKHSVLCPDPCPGLGCGPPKARASLQIVGYFGGGFRV